jgi:hypothetical protein
MFIPTLHAHVATPSGCISEHSPRR